MNNDGDGVIVPARPAQCVGGMALAVEAFSRLTTTLCLSEGGDGAAESWSLTAWSGW